MNKLTYFIFLTVGMYVFSAFTYNRSELGSSQPQNDHVDQVKDDTIRRATFNEWTARWDRRSKSYMANSKINYFNMPLANMTEFMKENPGGMRYYIGLDSTAAGFTPHLILTATDANGNLKTGAQFHLYNVTTVCPPSCER